MIPIVATLGSDPVETGLVSSLNRPEGNLTGVSVFAVQLVAKQLQLARALAPKAQTIAFFENPTNPTAKIGRDEIEAAGKSIGQKIVIIDVATETDVSAAFKTLAQNRSGAAIVESDPFFNGIAEPLVALAGRSGVPVVFPRREFVLAGGLISYGSSLTEAYRPARGLHWPNSQRRETSRSAGAAGYKAAPDHQYEDRQRAWHNGALAAAWTC